MNKNNLIEIKKKLLALGLAGVMLGTAGCASNKDEGNKDENGVPKLFSISTKYSNVDEYYKYVIQNGQAVKLYNSANVYLLFNKENKLCGWRNRETGEVKSFYPDFDPNQYTEYAFSGIHVLSPQIFDWMEEWTGKFSIINFYLSICARTNIHAYADENLHLIDVGKPETLATAEKWMKTLIV